MNECDGYLTDEGLCILTDMPVGEYPGLIEVPANPPRDELANTGVGPDAGFAILAALAVTLGLGLLRPRARRVR